MIWAITKKEFQSSLMAFRFLVGLVLYLILSVSSTHVLSRDYQDRLKLHREAVQAHQAELREVKVFSDLRVTLDRRPTPLSIVAHGEDRSFGRSVTVAYDQVPTETVGYDAKIVGQWMLGWVMNSFLEVAPVKDVFRQIDLTMVVQVVLSILALLLAHDAVSGEHRWPSLPAYRWTSLGGS